MKQDLEKHIQDIFDSLSVNIPFEVFDCKIDDLPEWTSSIQLTHEFLICCKDSSLKQKLHVFTGKNVSEYENNVFWFEGERIQPMEQPERNDPDQFETDEPVEYLKTDTRLPAYLDDLIFNHLNAVYAPDFQRFDLNLDLSKDEVLKYLGTYFPRSYAESFCIFDNIFQNRSFQKIITEKKTLNILSVGSGTGGDLIGLLTIIVKYCPKAIEVNICALDGNIQSLTVLEQIVDSFNLQIPQNINLTTEQSVFDSIPSIESKQAFDNEYDFIISFKLICEIISMGQGSLDNSYYDFAHKFLPMLSTNGLCVLLDVTTKPLHTTYNPILMNRQLNQALRELNEYGTLLPVPCSIFNKNCYFDCFHQQTFTVTHTMHTNDQSRVAYRIIVPSELKKQIGSSDNNSKFLINKDTICPYTEKHDKTEDAFLLKQPAS